MIVILEPDCTPEHDDGRAVLEYLSAKPGITPAVHQISGTQQTLCEIYLVGDTSTLERAEIEALPGVAKVVKVAREYAVLGRHSDDPRSGGFTYNGVRFDQDSLHVFAGLCAVDTPEHVGLMMKALKEHGQVCTRMGSYKPRTNPYSFQGLGAKSLPWVFELAGEYGIKVIAMEVTHDSHITEIGEALEQTGHPTGVMLQIGTRNTQNFELLKAVGRQREFPVLLKRGFGISLEESLNAAEYMASEGNRRVIFCLRGMKTSMGNPHRNLVDFAHVPVVRSLTLMPVCIDPSHSVGSRKTDPAGISDVMHATAQGVISGANMVLADFHPAPERALVDGPQAMLIDELPWFLEDIRIAREAYLARRELAVERQAMGRVATS